MTAQATIIAIVIITFIIKCLIRRAAAVGVARHPSLQRLYKDLNRDYFDNSLPLYRVRRRSFRHTGLDSALGFCDRATRTICLRNQLTPDEERHVLLHEMCHVATGPGVADHGPTFLRQLQRLIEKGETWAAGEYQYFAAEWRELKAVLDEEGWVEEQEEQS